MSFSAPYKLKKLPPELIELETKPVLKQCIKSSTALASLNHAAVRLPNKEVLLNTLSLLEAQSSSEIENIVTTTDALFKYDTLGTPVDLNTKEAMRYRHALFSGYNELKKRPVSTKIAEKVCSVIKGLEISVRKVPGTKLINEKTGEITYWPPEGESHLRELLSNWEQFIHTESDIEPLIRMAVAHYQFEAIHPFIDGNGRTGRIINLLILKDMGLLTEPVLYLSRYINQTRSEYYRLLLRVTLEDDWESWILYMLKAVETTSHWTLAKINKITNLMESTKQEIIGRAPKIYSAELVNVIFEQPYCQIKNLVEVLEISRQTASHYLSSLCDIGILIEKRESKTKLFMNPELIQTLKGE